VIQDGLAINHRLGRPRKITPDIVSSIEGNIPADATIKEGQMADMASEKCKMTMGRRGLRRKFDTS
jgi:hypothetical protein